MHAILSAASCDRGLCYPGRGAGGAAGRGALHRWAIAPQHIEQIRIVLATFKVSAPTIQRDCPSVVRSQHQNCFALLKAFSKAAVLLHPLAAATPSFVSTGRPETGTAALSHMHTMHLMQHSIPQGASGSNCWAPHLICRLSGPSRPLCSPLLEQGARMGRYVLLWVRNPEVVVQQL